MSYYNAEKKNYSREN